MRHYERWPSPSIHKTVSLFTICKGCLKIYAENSNHEKENKWKQWVEEQIQTAPTLRKRCSASLVRKCKLNRNEIVFITC